MRYGAHPAELSDSHRVASACCMDMNACGPSLHDFDKTIAALRLSTIWIQPPTAH